MGKSLWFGMVKRWYDSVRWRKASKSFLNRNPLCVFCAHFGRDTAATIVDHKKPHKGDYELFWNQDNWQGLCASCHSGIKRIQENKGHSAACDINGQPIDESHPWNSKKVGVV
jgi:5-methylcytosine-specific restriction endonuclease McrA